MILEIIHKERNEEKTYYMETKQHATKKPMGHQGNQRELKKYLETNDNENTTVQNLRDAAKAVLRGKFIAIQAFLKKEEKSQINNLTHHIKEQTKPKVSRREEIIKIREEIYKIEIQKTMVKNQ